jgi:hypothetical protein
VIDEVVKTSDMSLFKCFRDTFTAVKAVTFVIIVAVYGNKLTKEARKTPTIISKILIKAELNGESYVGRVAGLVSTINCHDLSVRNDMFAIDWSILLSVC